MDDKAAEGADFDFSNERPIRVLLRGDQFAECDDEDLVGVMASGPNPVELLAKRLFEVGADPARVLVLFRGNQRVGRTTVAIAAGMGGHE
jgi:hypothetical protein